MSHREKILLTLLTFISTAALGGCSADLVAIPPAGLPNNTISFCRENSAAVVTVKNIGDANAPPSVTTVKFFPQGVPIDIATPAIDAGSSVDLAPIPIPAGCFDPDCDFSFAVDSQNQVKEYKEDNNSAQGICIG